MSKLIIEEARFNDDLKVEQLEVEGTDEEINRFYAKWHNEIMQSDLVTEEYEGDIDE